jgi:signal transduction histidine kinase
MIYADKDQLKRVFQNLFSNAVSNIQDDRFIEVRALIENGQLHIEVADNGPGINPDTLPHLFTRYFTGDRLRQKIGSGLGLYICRMIIEQHGGRIWADSAPGKGTNILFEMPQESPREDD